MESVRAASPPVTDPLGKAAAPQLTIIFLTLGLDAIGYGMILPVLPTLLTQLVHGEAAASRYYGLFAAIYALMQLVFGPIFGGLSDRFGRRAVILPALLGAGLDYLLMALAPSVGWLFVGRSLSGIAGASATPGTAYLSDVMPPERRAQGYGMATAAFGIGVVIGPALGGLLGRSDIRLPFFIAGALNLMNFVLAAVLLPESLQPAHRRPFSWARSNPLGSLWQLGRSPARRRLTGVLLCGALSQQIVLGVWALHAQTRFGWDTLPVGGSLALTGILGALVQVVVLPRVIRHLGERRTMMSGLMVALIGLAAFGLARTGFTFIVMIPLFVYASVAGPITRSFLSREFSPSEQGLLHGSVASLVSLSAVIGPSLSTNVFALFCVRGATPYLPGAPFFLGSFFSGLSLLFARWGSRHVSDSQRDREVPQP
ncbi:MAG: TCR/Tet family MFS transporter [Polyangia bacterium]